MKRFLAVVMSCAILGAYVPVFAAQSAQDFVETLRDDDEATAQAAESMLVKMGPDAVRPLQKVLGDSNFKVRRRAAETLGQLGPQAKRAAPDLVLLLVDPQIEVQSAAQKALLQMGDDAIPALAQAVKSEHEGLRKVALTMLGQLGPKATPYLLSALKKDESAFIRASAAEALGSAKPVTTEIIMALTQALSDLEEAVRGAATDSLGQLGAASVPAVRTLFTMSHDDKDFLVRKKAADALLLIGNATPEAGALVAAEYQRLLQDPNSSTREEGIQVLSKLGMGGLPGLIQALSDKDNALCEEAGNAIVALGQSAVPALQTLQQSPYPYLSRKATELLSRIQGKPKHKPKKKKSQS